MYFPDNYHSAPIKYAGDLNSAATIDCASINMAHAHRCVIIFTFGTLAGASATLELYSGATSGACTSPCDFKYAWGSAAFGVADCDVLGPWTDAASVEITHTDKDNKMLQVMIEADKMDTNNGESWLTARFTDPGGATGTFNAVAIVEKRYQKPNSDTSVLA